MPLLKVHICSGEAPANKSMLTRRLRAVMIEALQIDEKLGQVILYETVPQLRAIHADRSMNFAFIEVMLYPGRTPDMKKALMKGLVEEVHRILNIDIRDISCCLQEIHQDNWYWGAR